MAYDAPDLHAHHDDADLASTRPSPAGGGRVPVAPGKATLTSRLQRRGPSVDEIADAVLQRLATRGSAAEPAAQHQVAAEGVRGGGGRLPFLDTIQGAFGHHEVGGVVAHTDDAARTAAGDLGAMAYAYGNDVAFGGAPDLFTAAHEAAHVVQQRGGVQLRDGIGAAGDVWEQHADAVAQRVVDGRSATDLLDPLTGGAVAAPSLARRVDIYSPGEGAQAVPARIQAFVARINAVSSGVRYTLPGRTLRAAETGRPMSDFDTRMRGFVDSGPLIPLLVVNSGGRARDSDDGPGPLGGVFIDQAENGYVDIDDMLGSDDSSFRLTLIHFIVERRSIPSYAQRRGISAGHAGHVGRPEFTRAHNAGRHAELAHLRALLNDPALHSTGHREAGGVLIFSFASPRGYIVVHSLSQRRPRPAEGENPTGDVTTGTVTIIRNSDRQHFTVEQWLAGPGARPDGGGGGGGGATMAAGANGANGAAGAADDGNAAAGGTPADTAAVDSAVSETGGGGAHEEAGSEGADGEPSA